MNMKYKQIGAVVGLACWALAACKKDFLDKPSTTTPTIDNYYNNATEVNGATGILYNAVWNDWSDKAFISVGDVLGGTVTGTQGNPQYNSFYNFNIQSTDGLIGDTWKSCYKAAGNASVLIAAFEQKKAKLGNADFLNLGIAEARFIRGFAYFYIGRTFGDAPIVADPLAITEPGKNLVPRYLQKDVIRFAIEDFKAAEAGLPAVSYQDGRVNKYSAKGMMAKAYLYLKDYDNAKTKAKEVIDYANANPGIINLSNDFEGIFTSSTKANMGNVESLFALKWLASMGWNGANRYQLYVGPQPLLRPKPTQGNGYSAVVPSLDMLDPATGWAPGDKRKGWSIMQHGFHRNDWVNENFPGGFTYDTTANTDDFHCKTGTRSSILKYVVGPNRSGEVVTTDSHTSMATYILRYADVLLIYAEAVLGSGGSTSDATALAAFNKVHTRAGLPAMSSINIDAILRERKCEFAFEGDYWFDISRQGFAKAKQLVAAQERSTLDGNGVLSNSLKITLSSPSQLLLPIPQAETVINPKLLEPAIAYY